MMQTQARQQNDVQGHWIPISYSIGLMFRRKRLFGLSFLLFGLTVLLTWGGYQLAIDFVDSLTRDFFAHAPDPGTILGWIKHKGWIAAEWLYSIISRIVSFYLAFLIAYTISTPGYSFLSSSAEKVHAGQHFDADATFTFLGVLIDIWEGFKVALLGVLVTIVALMVNVVPAIGQAAAFVLYVFYSALMFVDYPASRRRWSLGRKLGWIRVHSQPMFRLGLLPALVSMIPVLNIFVIAMLFPLLTIHSAVNFAEIETASKLKSTYRRER